MKLKNLLYITVGSALLTACSADYLDTLPQSSTDTGTVFETTENARLAVNGLCLMMTQQYLGQQGVNGEGTIKTWYGNYPGNDFQKCNLTGWADIINATSFLERNFGISKKDSVKFGCYYRQTGQPSSTEAFPDDTTIYINYTGRLLDGKVFDTTIRDTAKRYGLYSDSKTYSPVSVSYKNTESYSEITMGDSGSTLIDGFSYTISRMKSHEKGVGIFYSVLGYGSSGSGNAIPGFSVKQM